jgi:D-alanyl-D-alanine carboxypeptidase/D-alanyl-D-alanine-endopeptidase (penicillin-binding protein 4)
MITRVQWLFWLICTIATPAPALALALPDAVVEALTRAQVPPDAVSVLVVPADGQSAARLSHRPEVLMNPASVMKLVTTTAALDLLGPNYTWRTPVWLDGRIQNGVLKGQLVIQGQGDPKLVVERLWLLLRRVQSLGVTQIDGDIVLDRTAFALQDAHPGDFDGEPLRPYNVAPDALLLNFKSVVMTFTPDLASQQARVQVDLPLSGVRVPSTVPLRMTAPGTCADYRGALKADFSDPGQIRMNGSYPSDCGEKVWPVAYSDPISYSARAILGLWHSMGGKLSGSVRFGQAPAAPATFEVSSPPLAEIIRDINKYSNNVMAQQVFLTLARSNVGNSNISELAPSPNPSQATSYFLVPAPSFAQVPATREAARLVLQKWWQQRLSSASFAGTAGPTPTFDNGSGLSRQDRISARGLTRLLQFAYASPNMSELMSSLPIVGVDGTLKRSRAAVGSAHLKTGSLRDVLAVAGYVQGANGQQLCLVAIVNHPNASAARPALDALIDWTAQEATQPSRVASDTSRL